MHCVCVVRVMLLLRCRQNESPLCAVTQDATTVGDIGQ